MEKEIKNSSNNLNFNINDQDLNLLYEKISNFNIIFENKNQINNIIEIKKSSLIKINSLISINNLEILNNVVINFISQEENNSNNINNNLKLININTNQIKNNLNINLQNSPKLNKQIFKLENYSKIFNEVISNNKNDLIDNLIKPLNEELILISDKNNNKILSKKINIVNQIKNYYNLNKNINNINELNSPNYNKIKIQDFISKKNFIIEKDNEIFSEFYNINNELNKIILLENIEQKLVPIFKYKLKFYFDLLFKQTLNLNKNIEIEDIYNNKNLISNKEIVKLIYNSKLAEIIYEKNKIKNNDEYIKCYDIKGNEYNIKKIDILKILYSIYKNEETFKHKKYTFKLENKKEISIYPKNLRAYNIYNDYIIKSKINPYNIKKENDNIYFIINNEFLSKTQILNIINDNSNENKNDKYYLKLILHPNNKINEFLYIHDVNNKFSYFKKIYIEKYLNILISNLKFDYNIVEIKNYENKIFNIEIKKILNDYYEINESPFIVGDILNKVENSFYLNENKIIPINLKNLNEMFQYIIIKDMNGKNCYLRKPFLRNLLYNKNSNVETKDLNDNKLHVIDLSSIYKYNEDNNKDKNNINIDDKFIFYNLNDVYHNNHFANKKYINEINNKINYSKKNLRIFDYKDNIFEPILLNNNKIKLESLNEWVLLQKDNNDYFIFKSIIINTIKDYSHFNEDEEINFFDFKGNNIKFKIKEIIDKFKNNNEINNNNNNINEINEDDYSENEVKEKEGEKFFVIRQKIIS